jgi:hypothetical protein
MHTDGTYGGTAYGWFDTNSNFTLSGQGVIYSGCTGQGHRIAFGWDGSWPQFWIDGGYWGQLAQVAWCNNTFASSSWVLNNFMNMNNALAYGNGIRWPPFGPNYVALNTLNQYLQVWSNGGYYGAIYASPSDAILKRNVVPATRDALAAIREIALHAYDLVVEDEQPQHFDMGFIAQELETVIPQAVFAPPEKPRSVNTFPLVAYCVRAIQQLADRLEAMERRM